MSTKVGKSNKLVEKLIASAQKDLEKLSYCFHIPGLSSDDLKQEMYLKIILVAKKYDPSRSGMRTFVCNICRLHLIDLYNYHRRAKRYNDTYHLSLNEIRDSGYFQRLQAENKIKKVS